MEHIELKYGPDYKLQIQYTRSIGILRILEVITKNWFFKKHKMINPVFNRKINLRQVQCSLVPRNVNHFEW